jgi:hypothetical protein
LAINVRVYNWTSEFYSADLYVYPYTKATKPWLLQLGSSEVFKFENVSLPSSLFLFKIVLAIPGHLNFQMNCKVSLSNTAINPQLGF